VLGPEKSQVATYAGVPVQERPSWRVYATQEPCHIVDWNTDETVSARLKEGLAGQGIQVGPLVFVPLTTPHRRLGALGMSGAPGTVYSSDDISFLRLIGRVVALAIGDNFNLRQAETAREELERQNDRLQQSETELRELRMQHAGVILSDYVHQNELSILTDYHDDRREMLHDSTRFSSQST